MGDELVMTLEDLQGWFDTVVNEIIDAMRESLNRVAATGKTVDYMLIVGGFGSSPYLEAKLRGAFSDQVGRVVSPGVPYTSCPERWDDVQYACALIMTCVLPS